VSCEDVIPSSCENILDATACRRSPLWSCLAIFNLCFVVRIFLSCGDNVASDVVIRLPAYHVCCVCVCISFGFFYFLVLLFCF